MNKIFKSTDTNVRIAMLRHSKKLSQQKFADALGVDRVMVGYWETGRSYPSYKYFKLMCEIFNVSADWLMGFSNKMYRES